MPPAMRMTPIPRAICPKVLVDQRFQVVTVGGPEEHEEQERQGAEHDGGDPALSGQGPDLALEAVAGTHGVTDGLQHLGEVATDLTLDLDRHDRPLEVLRLGPLDDALQESVTVRPSRASTMARPNSRAVGIGCLRDTASVAWRSE